MQQLSLVVIKHKGQTALQVHCLLLDGNFVSEFRWKSRQQKHRDVFLFTKKAENQDSLS